MVHESVSLATKKHIHEIDLTCYDCGKNLWIDSAGCVYCVNDLCKKSWITVAKGKYEKPKKPEWLSQALNEGSGVYKP
jgi:hypothetical protein